MRFLATCFCLCALAVLPVAAQHHDHGGSQEKAEPAAMPLLDNLGAHQRSVTTAVPRAQQYFNQGMQLAYAFGRREAAAAFREAQRHDADCAMCYWGEAWALGPYINEPMDSTAGIRAFEAARLAKQHAPAEGVERALIGAMALRYAPTPTAENRASLDSAYAEAMRDVVRRYPSDLDAGALFGEALMVLSPWDHWAAGGEPKPGTEETIAVLESVLGRNLKHPGACHLYIHLMEASPEPERAEACADFLAAGIPGASHIQHMPSHIYMNIGRYADGVRANQKAWRVDQQAAKGQGVAIYPEHNLHMLVFAGWLDGQSAVAIQAAKDLVKLSPADAWQPMLQFVRFGRWEEVLALSPPEASFDEGLWHFSRGLAYVRTDRADSAHASLQALDAALAATPEDATYGFMLHPQRSLLGMARGILAGELAACEGDYQAAEKALRAALPLEDGLAYDEPEPWPLPLRQVLGAILLEGEQPQKAEQVYREDLERHPRNGWSLYGLARSLKAQGDDAAARETWKAFEKAWDRADVWLESSRF